LGEIYSKRMVTLVVVNLKEVSSRPHRRNHPNKAEDGAGGDRLKRFEAENRQNIESSSELYGS